MTPQIHSADDIAVAEAELSRQEAALETESTRLKALRRQATDQLTRAKHQAEDPALVAALGHLEVPSVSVRTQIDEARMARMKALAARKSCLEKARAALVTHEAELVAVVERVEEEEHAAKQRAVQKSAAAEAARKAAKAKKVAEQSEALRAQGRRPQADGEPVEDSLEATMIRAMAEQPEEAPSPRPTVAAKPAPAAAQRRATPRAQLCAEISLGSDHNFFTGFTNDVSEGGVFVATVNVLPLGTHVDLEFSLPHGPKIKGSGEVRWVREFDERNPDVFPGMGIKFTDVPEKSIAAIHAFTVQREPMFFPEH